MTAIGKDTIDKKIKAKETNYKTNDSWKKKT